VCQYNWCSAGSLGWPFPMLKYKYSIHIQYTEAVLSNSNQKRLWFAITKMLIAVLKINLCYFFITCNFIVLFIIIFGTLSYPVTRNFDGAYWPCIVNAMP